jgi:hypothetical protein
VVSLILTPWQMIHPQTLDFLIVQVATANKTSKHTGDSNKGAHVSGNDNSIYIE